MYFNYLKELIVIINLFFFYLIKFINIFSIYLYPVYFNISLVEYTFF